MLACALGRRILLITFDRVHYALNWPAAHVHCLDTLHHHRVVLWERLKILARPHLNDLVTTSLEVIENLRDSVRSRVLEIVHQDDSLAVLLELGDHGLSHLLGTAHFKVE